jgi:aspartyl-tRNA(Asn)/glutamyl-tRNA(Gln) amidotransferase subunit C
MERSQIRHVAELAELTLSEDEELRLVDEIGQILAHVAELEAVDTRDVPPTAHINAEGAAPLRADVARPGLTHEDALAGAPRTAHGGFVVPTFVE